MRLIIVSGLSGSGKSVALHALEDLGFYCIDNIPAALLSALISEISNAGEHAVENVGVGLDARNRSEDLDKIPEIVRELRSQGIACEIIFLQAGDDVLLTRFSDTRRRHPLTTEDRSLPEAITRERTLLGPLIRAAELVIDTTATSVYDLRELIRERVGEREPHSLSILIESFGYKHGLPADADFVFDVRCLPNPYWEPNLRPLCGTDEPVRAFLGSQPAVSAMIDDICSYLESWIPHYQGFQRSYLTIAIGCTGGQHRSVYITEAVAKRLTKTFGPIKTRHHELPRV